MLKMLKDIQHHRIIPELPFYEVEPTMAKKNQDPFSVLIKDLEKKTGGTLLLMEHLEDSQPSSPSSAWLLSKEHIILSRPVATLAFQVSSKLQTMIESSSYWKRSFGRSLGERIHGLIMIQPLSIFLFSINLSR